MDLKGGFSKRLLFPVLALYLQCVYALLPPRGNLCYQSIFHFLFAQDNQMDAAIPLHSPRTCEPMLRSQERKNRVNNLLFSKNNTIFSVYNTLCFVRSALTCIWVLNLINGFPVDTAYFL